MERIQALIDKLHHQKQQNCNPAQLLFTVQLLHSELLNLQQKNGTLGTAKVAVTLPAYMNFSEEVTRSVKPEITEETEQPAAIQEFQEVEILQVQQPAYEQKEYTLRRPVIRDEEMEKIEEPIAKYAPRPQQVLNPAFSSVVDTPTLSQYQPKKELHEVIVERKTSLNDSLKEEKKEIVHKLKETPIKDLRKGIGINDRFTFVTELFRGDEAMYERSIKTINGLHIYSEAEYWINRELKFKLGWDDTKETVKHFYDLVRRRFSAMN